MLTSNLKQLIGEKWDNCWPVSNLRPIAILDLTGYIYFLKKSDDLDLISKKVSSLKSSHFILSKEIEEFTWCEFKDMDAQAIHDLFARRFGILDLMNEYAPNFRRSVLGRQVLTPVDLERRFGLTGGNIMQGTMSLSSLSFMRPVPGYADYRTPIRGLYLCGAATHPGGGVMGACGYNAAREIMRDMRLMGCRSIAGLSRANLRFR